MRKKRIDTSKAFEKKYSNDKLKKHIQLEVENAKFNLHCEEVAKNLNINVTVVKELLLNNSFLVLALIQKSVLQNKVVKINITGYFSFVTTLLKFKTTHLRAVTKGKTY